MDMKAMKSIGLGLLLLVVTSVAFGFAVYGAIGDKYAKLSSERGPLGAPLTDEASAPFGGRFNNFQHGFIYWHPETGAFAVWGAIGEKWNEFGRVSFGYPTTDELITPDGRGRFNHFRKIQEPGKPETSIYWTPQTGAHVVYGEIRKAWANQGWERGGLGYPTSDEFQDGQFRRSNFENGFIIWSAEGGAVIKITPRTNLIFDPRLERHQLGYFVHMYGKGFTPGGEVRFAVEDLEGAAGPKSIGIFGIIKADGTFSDLVWDGRTWPKGGTAKLRAIDKASGSSITAPIPALY